MCHELEDAWRTFAPHQPPYLLAGDEALLRPQSRATVLTFRTLAEYTASNSFVDPKDTSLHLGLIPAPFFGRLRSARVFILMTNPGLHAGDYFAEAEVQYSREAQVANLRAELPLLWLDPKFAWHPGFEYWHAKLRKIVADLAKAWRMAYQDALKKAAEQIAVLQLFPYHSANFRLSNRALDSVRSVGLMQRYVRDVLVPRARRGEVLIVVTRKARYWGLPTNPHIVVYETSKARGAHLTPSSQGGARILEYLGPLSSEHPNRHDNHDQRR